jgi:hypothetical protein
MNPIISMCLASSPHPCVHADMPTGNPPQVKRKKKKRRKKMVDLLIGVIATT